jgi:molecular chaperone Hsp33
MPYSATVPGKDLLHRFLFENSNLRGELVHLDDSWQAVLERHDYPAPVRNLLGQALAAVALLGATLKSNGTLILQIQGDGPVSLLVAQVDRQSRLRGMADWHDDAIAAIDNDTLAELCGDGRLALTIDPGDGNTRYQSIIELGRNTLAQALDNYFLQSEQLDTRLWLTANDRCAAGLLIQALPPEISDTPPDDDDIWNRIIHLSETLSDSELSDLPVMELLKRLYHEEDVRLFEADELYFHCRCSRENIADTLRSLGYDETRSIIDEQGVIKVECNFCKKSYEFDRVDNEALFASERPHDLSTTRH